MLLWTEDAAVGFELPEVMDASDVSTPITYSLTGLPDGLMFDPATREITGTPDSAVIGTTGKIVYRAEADGYETAEITYPYTVRGTADLPDAHFDGGSIEVTGDPIPGQEITFVLTLTDDTIYDQARIFWSGAPNEFSSNTPESQGFTFKYTIPNRFAGARVAFGCLVLLYGHGLTASVGSTDDSFVSKTVSVSAQPAFIAGLNNDYLVVPNFGNTSFGRITAPTLADGSVHDELEYWWKGTDYIVLQKDSSDTVDDDGFVNTGDAFINYGYNARNTARDTGVELKILAKGDGTTALANTIYTGLTEFDAREEIQFNQPTLPFSGSLTNDGSGG